MALELFGREGPDRVSIRAVAERAEVSPALVMHHFGSKEGLIAAVDDYFIERVTQYLEDFTAKADPEEAKSVLVSMADEPALIAYLGRALAAGEPAGAELFDRLFGLTLEIIESMVEAGLARPVEDRQALATLLLISDLGMIVLRHHVARTLGDDPYGPEGLARLAAVDLDLKTHPLLTYPNGGGQ